MSNIYNKDHFLNSFWDWSHLNGCFGSDKIKVSDHEGIVERNGYFLIYETKHPGGGQKDIPTGQSILLDAHVNSGDTWVVLIWGETNKPERAYLITPSRSYTYKTATWETLQQISREWGEWVSKQPRRFKWTHPDKCKCQWPKGFFDDE